MESLQEQLCDPLGILYTRAQATEYAPKLTAVVDTSRQNRSSELKARDDDPDLADWFRSHQRVAYSLYPHLFAAATGVPETPLQRLAGQVSYFEELGCDVIHVLRFLKFSIDDGFGVDDYTAVDESLGTKDDFCRFVRACHERRIYVAADFVLNHVSSNHKWARRAEDGDTSCERFFYWDETNTGDPWPGVFEFFPEIAPGHWDYVPKRDRWVWATFYKRWPKGRQTKQWPAGQWDLNYHEPEVLLGMVQNLLELANWGIDVFRLDAVAYIWKQRGTRCENLDEVYTLLSIFRLCLKAVAPNAVMLAEWNAPPQYLTRYFETGGELAYNFGALPGLWEAVRLGRVRGLRNAFEEYRKQPGGVSTDGIFWLFSECHDELNLGGLSRERIQELSRCFWECGGVPFRCPLLAECRVCRPSAEWCFRHGDRFPTGVCGTTYSLLGGPQEDAARKRLRLMWFLKLSLGGTPLFYMGEELGTAMARQDSDSIDQRSDTRSVKRLPLTVEQIETRGGDNRRLFDTLQGLIKWRKRNAFLMAEPEFFDTGSESVLGFKKPDQGRTVYLLANCCGQSQLAVIPIGNASGKVELVGPPGSAGYVWERVSLGSTDALVVNLGPYDAWAVRN